VHVAKSFLLCILIFKKGIGKRKKSKGGLEGSIPRPVGGWACHPNFGFIMTLGS
jgi:hypothetical protein